MWSVQCGARHLTECRWTKLTPEFPFWGLYICVDFNFVIIKQTKRMLKKTQNNISL